MTTKKKPEVHLEITSGTLRLATDEAIYFISAPKIQPLAIPPQMGAYQQLEPNPMVTLDQAQPPSSPPPFQAEAGQFQPAAPSQPPASSGNGQDSLFFQELTEKLYRDIGTMARKLSVTINEFEVDPAELNIIEKGQQVEQARDQLSSIVELTEQATMNIMDKTDQIQEDVEQARRLVSSMDALDFMGDEERDVLLTEVDRLAKSFQVAGELLRTSLGLETAVIERLSGGNGSGQEAQAQTQTPPPVEASPPPAETVKRIVFPLSELFQILYELAVGEEVKKAIKAVWNGVEQFDDQKVQDMLNPQSDDFERDEGFVMVPLEPLLKSLYTATENDAFKTTVKKLNASREKLFLDQSLPVEIHLEEVEVEAEAVSEPAPEPVPEPAPESDDSPPSEGMAELKEGLEAHLQALRTETEERFSQEANLEVLGKIKSSALIQGDQANRIKEELGSAGEVINRITDSLTGILEALTFQDLTGQQIQKTMAVLNDFQVELLKLLVSIRSLMSEERTGAVKDQQQKEELAQQDVDEMLGKLGLGPAAEEVDLEAGPGVEGRLDQEAVDSMLVELGF